MLVYGIRLIEHAPNIIKPHAEILTSETFNPLMSKLTDSAFSSSDGVLGGEAVAGGGGASPLSSPLIRRQVS